MRLLLLGCLLMGLPFGSMAQQGTSEFDSSTVNRIDFSTLAPTSEPTPPPVQTEAPSIPLALDSVVPVSTPEPDFSSQIVDSPLPATPESIQAPAPVDSAELAESLDSSEPVNSDMPATGPSHERPFQIDPVRAGLQDQRFARSEGIYWLGFGATIVGFTLQLSPLVGGGPEQVIFGTGLFMLGTPLMGWGSKGMLDVAREIDPGLPASMSWSWYGLSWLSMGCGALMVADENEFWGGAFLVGGVVLHYIAAWGFAKDGVHASSTYEKRVVIQPVLKIAHDRDWAPGLQLSLLW